jgi:hypothetical protein
VKWKHERTFHELAKKTLLLFLKRICLLFESTVFKWLISAIIHNLINNNLNTTKHCIFHIHLQIYYFNFKSNLIPVQVSNSIWIFFPSQFQLLDLNYFSLILDPIPISWEMIPSRAYCTGEGEVWISAFKILFFNFIIFFIFNLKAIVAPNELCTGENSLSMCFLVRVCSNSLIFVWFLV